MAHAFVDTSAWFAYVNRLDPDYTRIRSLFQTFQGRLVTSNFIFDETVTLCLYRLGYRVAATVGEVLLDPTVVDLLRLTPDDEHRAWTLFLDVAKIAQPLPECLLIGLGLREGSSSTEPTDSVHFRR
jgi:uncharacterized protein